MTSGAWLWLGAIPLLAGLACSSGSSTGAANAGGGGMTAGNGGQTAGSGGQTAVGGASASGGGGAQAGGSSSGGAGGSAPGLGAECFYTDNSSSLNAIDESSCDTGHCLWDGRYFGESYCTIACSGVGAACPDGYQCAQDQGSPSSYWCARTMPQAPTDLGTACTSEYLSDCMGAHPLQEFCLAPSVDSCQNKYCAYDGISKDSYCSTPCRTKTAPCPDGWDCWRNPSGITGVFDACIKHHAAADFVGVSCYHGTPYDCQSGMPCYTSEAGTVPSCAPQIGACIYDLRPGVTKTDYCSMRCETDPCPTGYSCMTLPIGVSSAMYCVQQL
ncbi:MAG: hypothetical protein ABW061_09245 [Polyangiaceae bacterium]